MPEEDAPSSELVLCCDDFRAAVEVGFATPIDGPTGWLLYGTDQTTVSGGAPELRYWPIRNCPFCGAPLDRDTRRIRRVRRFGYDAADTERRRPPHQ